MLFVTWGHRASSWLADMRTNFTPSSLFEMEQARLATWEKKTELLELIVLFLYRKLFTHPNSDHQNAKCPHGFGCNKF